MKEEHLSNVVGKSDAAVGGKGGAVSKPLYQRIVQELQSEIVLGRYPVGTLLPSEAELTQRFSVSRHTIRSAVRALADAGLVKSHQGLGTLVQRPGDAGGYVHRIDTISDLFPHDAETRQDPVDGTLVPLPQRVRECFPHVPDEGLWLRITGDRRKLGTAEPFNELEVYVAARFAGVGRLVGGSSGSIYAMLEAIYGETISEVEQVIGGFTSDGKAGARIGLRKGDAGIEVRRVHRVSSDGEVGILSFNRYPIAEYTFSMVLRRAPG
jgi:DNA-binding GntR family transcriptional regulator